MNAPVRTPLILTDAQFEEMTRRDAFVTVGRVELRGGVITPMSPVHLPLARVMTALLVAVQNSLSADGSPLQVLAEISIRFGRGFQPTADIVVWDPSSVPAGYDGPLPAAAVKLVIEVADSSAADDLGDKHGDYAEAGLAEYWVADVKARTLSMLTAPEGRAYTLRADIGFGDPAQARTLALTIDTASL